MKINTSYIQNPIRTDSPFSRGNERRTPTQKSPITTNTTGSLLYFQGQNLKTILLNSQQNNPALLATIAQELEKYKQDRLKEKKEKLRRNSKNTDNETVDDIPADIALCQFYLKQIAEKLRDHQKEKETGLSLFYDENQQLILNGINLHQLLKQCEASLTPRGRIFLRGIRNRLYMILREYNHNSKFNKLNNVVSEIVSDINDLLENPNNSQFVS